MEARRAIRSAYYLFEDHPDLAKEFAYHVNRDMPVPQEYHGGRFDIMNPRADAVRPKIWKYLLQSTRDITPYFDKASQKGLFLGSQTSSLLRLNKKSSAETVAIFYGDNTFQFSTEVEKDYSGFLDFMRGLGPSQLQALRSIHLIIDPQAYRQTTDYYVAAALAYFVGNHSTQKQRQANRPVARLEQLKISIVGDFLFTKDDYVLMWREFSKSPEAAIGADQRVKRLAKKVDRHQGQTRVVLNTLPLERGPDARGYHDIDGLKDGLDSVVYLPCAQLKVEGTSNALLRAQQKLTFAALSLITGYKRLVVEGRLDPPFHEVIHRAMSSKSVEDVIRNHHHIARPYGAPFCLDDMYRINWPPIRYLVDRSGKRTFPDANAPDPEKKRVLMGFRGDIDIVASDDGDEEYATDNIALFEAGFESDDDDDQAGLTLEQRAMREAKKKQESRRGKAGKAGSGQTRDQPVKKGEELDYEVYDTDNIALLQADFESDDDDGQEDLSGVGRGASLLSLLTPAQRAVYDAELRQGSGPDEAGSSQARDQPVKKEEEQDDDDDFGGGRRGRILTPLELPRVPEHQPRTPRRTFTNDPAPQQDDLGYYADDDKTPPGSITRGPRLPGRNTRSEPPNPFSTGRLPKLATDGGPAQGTYKSVSPQAFHGRRWVPRKTSITVAAGVSPQGLPDTEGAPLGRSMVIEADTGADQRPIDSVLRVEVEDSFFTAVLESSPRTPGSSLLSPRQGAAQDEAENIPPAWVPAATQGRTASVPRTRDDERAAAQLYGDLRRSTSPMEPPATKTSSPRQGKRTKTVHFVENIDDSSDDEQPKTPAKVTHSISSDDEQQNTPTENVAACWPVQSPTAPQSISSGEDERPDNTAGRVPKKTARTRTGRPRTGRPRTGQSRTGRSRTGRSRTGRTRAGRASPSPASSTRITRSKKVAREQSWPAKVAQLFTSGDAAQNDKKGSSAKKTSTPEESWSARVAKYMSSDFNTNANAKDKANAKNKDKANAKKKDKDNDNDDDDNIDDGTTDIKIVRISKRKFSETLESISHADDNDDDETSADDTLTLIAIPKKRRRSRRGDSIE